jgi:hypothetical protein
MASSHMVGDATWRYEVSRTVQVVSVRGVMRFVSMESHMSGKEMWVSDLSSAHLLPACSLGLSATSQQCFSLRRNQPPATSQQYFSLRTNQHQPSATSHCYLSIKAIK